jgi:hypothetical protein
MSRVGESGKVNQVVEDGRVDSMRWYNPKPQPLALLFWNLSYLRPGRPVNGKCATYSEPLAIRSSESLLSNSTASK